MLREIQRLQRQHQLESERRTEPRFGAEGEVTLVVGTPAGEVEFRGKLLDFSLHGLRVRHDYKELTSGQEVRVFFVWGEITTKVMWSTPSGESLETGLRLF
ncbi:MAG TPA: PilZ domain-containing protein [Terriglobales bacterium]|nr:PilZ domain-containing protein [Terriglobales bacterium]